MSPTALLLPSPLLPPVAYEPLQAGLERQGYATRLADASAPVSGAKLVERWQPLARDADLLVGHSNAGYLLPLVRPTPSTPAVFVDAALLSESGPVPLAPLAFRAQLVDLADEAGRLPPWTRWWPRDEMTEVVPPERFASLDAACPRVSLAYLESEVTAPDGWTSGPNAYLVFGTETYADEVAFARAHGWPTQVLRGLHLHFLWDPDQVAAAVVRLAQALR